MDGTHHDLALSVVWYVAAYAVGLGAFAIMAVRRGIATDGVAILALAGLLGGALGAQLVQLLGGGVPGKSLVGGIALGYVAVVVAKRRLGIVRPTGDLFAVALAAGESIGRVGCFVAGCCYGKATHLAWAIVDRGELRHPTQLYSAFAATCTLAVLVALERRRTLPENGLLYVQGTLLCASRFAIDFAREAAPVAFGLTATQLACVCGVAFFGYRATRTCVGMRPVRLAGARSHA